jgi:uncharacterized protein (DUF885 family)
MTETAHSPSGNAVICAAGAAAPAPLQQAAAAGELERLCDEYFALIHTLAPFTATQLGVSGFDALVADPGHDGAARGARQIASIEKRLRRIDTGLLDDAGQTNAAVLGHLSQAARTDLEHGLWDANASARGYVSPSAILFQSVPAALLRDAAAFDDYRQRLRRLPGFLDAVTGRYRQAVADGRDSTQIGIRQAIRQLANHLALPPAADTLVTVALPDTVDAASARQQLADIVAAEVRPALRRLLHCLQQDLLPLARPDDQVGIRFVPGGDEGYLAAVRRQTTTCLTPDQAHQIGLDSLAGLHEEWAELGGRVLGTGDLPATLGRLREDRAQHCTDARQIMQTVAAALARAEAVRDQWFPRYDIADCVIEEIDPAEAGSAAPAYYRPPAGGGLRPGAHRVLTARPAQRLACEYEALSFHVGMPGHHLQIASAQTQSLPAYRRFLDAELCGYVEGWGTYGERLADEMGLYSSDLNRLGMLASEARRACRLVVDTGMHYYGWSRARAADFMWRNTAATRASAAAEVDRCIGWPGHAVAHITGRLEIQRLRRAAERELGPRFDIRAFHGTVLGSGAVPLGVLAQLVARWVARTRPGPR